VTTLPGPVDLHVVVPGPIEQRTGGYLYDARMVAGLRRRGWRVAVHSLAGRFPEVDAAALASLRATLASVPSGARVLLDGLAIGGVPAPLREAAGRLRLLALVHHPLGDETALDPDLRRRWLHGEPEALAACRGVLVTSPYTAVRLGELGVPASRIRVARPGTDRVPPARRPSGGEPPLLLCVGAVVPRKGQRELVQALAALDDLAWRCVCAGSLDRDPAYAAAARALAVEAGLGDRVRWVGECDAAALEDWYRQAALFVLPSHYEGYGMALTEALAHGLGVVSTTGGAIPQTVPAGAAVLVPPGDPAALSAALRPLLATGGAVARDALARAAVDHAAALPDWDEAAGIFAAAIHELTPDGHV